MRRLFLFMLLSNAAMFVWSAFVVAAPRAAPRYTYSGWIAAVGLACGNVTMLVESFSMVLCNRTCVPCMMIVGLAAFVYALVWGVHFVQQAQASDQQEFFALIVGQLVHAGVLAAATAGAVVHRACAKARSAPPVGEP